MSINRCNIWKMNIFFLLTPRPLSQKITFNYSFCSFFLLCYTSWEALSQWFQWNAFVCVSDSDLKEVETCFFLSSLGFWFYAIISLFCKDAFQIYIFMGIWIRIIILLVYGTWIKPILDFHFSRNYNSLLPKLLKWIMLIAHKVL